VGKINKSVQKQDTREPQWRGPLDGVRVLELSGGRVEMCGRYLADLGAQVVLIEPPGGMGSRRSLPFFQDVSLTFAMHNANKLSMVLDIDVAADRELLLKLVENSDILIESLKPGRLKSLGLEYSRLAQVNPALIMTSISDFGSDGPSNQNVGTNSVHMALGGVLSRSGLPGREPLMPPGSLAMQAASMSAAWASLLGYWNALETGLGDYVDVSIQEATTQLIDPVLGVSGSATMGSETDSRDRPSANRYPIFRTHDGFVRVCMLTPKQWRAMRSLIGDPQEFSDGRFDSIDVRNQNFAVIHSHIAGNLAGRTTGEVIQTGHRLGVPIAPILTPAQVLKEEHFVECGALRNAEVAQGVSATVPSGFVVIDNERIGHRSRAPEVGGDNDRYGDYIAQRAAQSPTKFEVGGRHPLKGVRVIDLGVVVFGAEVARLFADQGADVVKIESTEFPDVLRQRFGPSGGMSESFAVGHRGVRSIGLNLKDPKGREIFSKLVSNADIALSNFKPGTMEALGLGYDEIRAMNPRMIVAEASAFGAEGKWGRWPGYGPLVRAATGVTSAWRYPETDDGFCDGITVVPDHLGAMVEAIAILAKLISRRITGMGGHVELSQSEVLLTSLSVQFAMESLTPGAFVSAGSDSPFGSDVYKCSGDEEWCVVSIRDDDDWQRLCDLLDPQGSKECVGEGTDIGVSSYEQIQALLREFTEDRSANEVMTIMQGLGIPAGMMRRGADYDEDPQLRFRNFALNLTQPGFEAPLRTMNGPARFLRIPDPMMRAAPLQGEHTSEILTETLGYSQDEIENLVDNGVVELSSERP
jgi:crotonobetainyl-CoA:carnitine CoA-transferase CaiB-like acyl-CoA transferase